MPRGGVSWNKKQEPKFIREFKERIAYKERETIETKKKVLEKDIVIEKEEDRPQVVQLKSGDLGEDEYLKLKSKEEIENSASSFGRILFKRPNKKTSENNPTTSADAEQQVKRKEIDLIFNLDQEGKEVVEEEPDQEQEAPVQKKKTLLGDDEEPIQYGLIQQPATKKRFVDQIATTKRSDQAHIPAAKVLAREAKIGNKKLLSFYDEEQEEVEQFHKQDFEERKRKKEEQEEQESD